MQILFADKFPAEHLHSVAAMGHEYVLDEGLSADNLPDKINGAQVLVVRSTKVTAETFAAASALRMVIRAGAGTNTIDKECAAKKGIYVCNVPSKNAIAVAELTLGLILAIDRKIPDNVTAIRNRDWDKSRFSVATGLFGRRLGIVGTGAIGLAVAERARAFGLGIHVIEKSGRNATTQSKLNELEAKYVPDLESLATLCDILSFHVPASDENRGLVGETLLSLMRPGSIIINTSRGDIVDEPALIRALDEKDMWAGLDVYNDEPGSTKDKFDSSLARHPNVYGTHHIGASTSQAQDAVARGVLEILDAFGRGTVLHCVNGVV